jgi:hypothetical protein
MQRTACSAPHATRGMRHSHTTRHLPKHATFAYDVPPAEIMQRAARGVPCAPCKQHGARSMQQNTTIGAGRVRSRAVHARPHGALRVPDEGRRSARASRERARPWRWLVRRCTPTDLIGTSELDLLDSESSDESARRRRRAPELHARCALRAPVCGPTSQPLAAQAPTTRRSPARTRAPDRTPSRRRRAPPPPPAARRRARFGARSPTGGACGSCSRRRHGRSGRRRRRSARSPENARPLRSGGWHER